MKNAILFTFILFSITSCISTKKVSSFITEKNFSIPELDVEAVSELGENVYTSGLISYNKGAYLNENITFKLMDGKVEVKSCDLELESSKKDLNGYSPLNENDLIWSNAIFKNNKGNGIIWVDKNTFEIKKATINGGMAIPLKADNKIFLKEKEIVRTQNSNFKKEFIYNGKAGTVLKFTYREFLGDLARPAFNQDVQYDLNESNQIGFKGLRILVINATNSKLTYKVIEKFK